MDFSEEYDYVVVGAGSAGCVIARRLTELTEARILVLEAGGDDRRTPVERTDVPSMTSMWGDPAYTWPYATTPQPGLDGRSIRIPQGRLLGGGSSVNAMMYVRGNRRDFDAWHACGNPGWSADEVEPYFRRAEAYTAGDGLARGADGPLSIVPYGTPSAVSEAFVRATRELGLAESEGDYNTGRQEAKAFYYQSTRTKDNLRCSTATAYLRPVMRDPRLTVRTGAEAARVLVEDGAAVGVEYRSEQDGGGLRRVRATGEVILTAGTLATPKLLLNSGIGPADALRALGVAPVLDLPGVGRNLQDHLLVGVGFASLRDLPFPELLSEAGLFTDSGAVPGGNPEAPDLQFFFGPVQFVDEQYRTDGPGFTFAPILLQPRSRGTVALGSPDPFAPAVIDPHYLQDPADLEVLVRGVELARELAACAAFAEFTGRELAPGADRSREQVAAYVRQGAGTVWHPVGTCRMGRGPDAVVDERLLLHGLDRLRVADASIMPTITRGNTNAATIMIGEKAADLIAAAA